MENRKKPRPVLLNDSDYSACLRICGPRGFSSWASKLLLAAASVSPMPMGSVAGGTCGMAGCREVGAWFYNPSSKQYLCQSHGRAAAEFITIEDRRPANFQQNEAFVRAGTEAVAALVLAKHDGAVDVLLRGAAGLAGQGEREKLVSLMVEIGAMLKSMSPKETTAPPPSVLPSLPPSPPTGAVNGVNHGIFDLPSSKNES